MKTYFSQDPIFEQSKLVTSIYPNDLEETLDTNLSKKVAFDCSGTDVSTLTTPNYTSLMQVAIDYSDGLVLAGENIPEEVLTYANAANKPMLSHQESQSEESHVQFFNAHFLQ